MKLRPPFDAPVAVIGAGIAGLTAARELRRRDVPLVVFEAGEQIAGLGRSFRDEQGFTYDFGAHFITNRFAAALGVGAACRTVRRFGETVLLDGTYYAYPFGLLRSPSFLSSAVRARLVAGWRNSPDSAADWYRLRYGAKLAHRVAIPLVEAWSGAPAGELAPSVSPPQLDRGIPQVLKLKLASHLSGRAVANGFSRAQPESPHVFHVYPPGGVGILAERLAQGLEDDIVLESRVEAIYVEDNHGPQPGPDTAQPRVVGIRVNGRDRAVAGVISTAPVNVLPKLLRGTPALDHLSRFRYRAMALVNMRFRVRPLLPDVCVWIPDTDYTFFRLTEAPLAMPWMAPSGKTMVTVDIGCEVGDRIWTMEDEALGRLCLEELDALFPGARDRYLGCRVLRTPIAHPVYLRQYEEERVQFSRNMPIDGLISVGRNGEFAHILMEDVYWKTRDRLHGLLDATDAYAPDSEALGGHV